MLPRDHQWLHTGAPVPFSLELPCFAPTPGDSLVAGVFLFSMLCFFLEGHP